MHRCAFTLIAVLCAACEAGVSLDAAPDARAGCEAPSDDGLAQTARMLPGRVCQACHIAGGQAGSVAWTASGTIYARADARCNDEGVEGVKVELLDEADRTLIVLTTNRAGNFFTAESLPAVGIRARLHKDGRVREMMGLQGSTACASCHRPGGTAPGRIYLD